MNNPSDLPRRFTSSAIQAESLVLGAGVFLTLISLFLPWFDPESTSVRGWFLALNGYPFLLAPPFLGAFAFALSSREPKTRPVARMLPGVLGLLCFFLLFCMVVNYDTGTLALVSAKNLAHHLQVLVDGEPRVISGLGDTGSGIYLILLGLFLLILGPLMQRWKQGPTRRTARGQGCRPDQVQSLEELQAPSTPAREIRQALGIFLAGAVLIFTYTWCGMSPAKLWENRGNAREYLFGRDLSQADIDYIEEQVTRAAEIEAQGRAREFMDNKYRSVPIEEQPGLEAKMKENEAMAAKFLAEMTPEEKKRLADRARKYSLQEKEGGYFPPETAWTRIRGYIVALLETVAIAIWGTLLAIVCAVPVSLFAAKNTLRLIVPGEGRLSRFIRWFSIFFVRRFLDACRGFNEFVMALIFVAVIGLGPYAGILALWIHTFGILGKVFSEQIEAIDPGQVEALSSTGAAVDQTIAFSVIPQVMPGLVSYSLLRFESNVRSAAVLGFVGAGGIGFLIFDKLNGYLFREVCTMMIIIIMAVGIIDYLCGKLRARFI